MSFRPIEADDIRYVFAAYKKGSLASMGEQFSNPDMPADEFKTAFEAWVLERYHAAWTMFAQTGRGFIPVGLLFSCFAPSAPYMIVNGVVWFPWATKRNIIESIVNFFNEARKEYQFVLYALPEHRKAYEVCAMHGIMRRIGTSYVAIPGKPATVFETRAA